MTKVKTVSAVSDGCVDEPGRKTRELNPCPSWTARDSKTNRRALTSAVNQRCECRLHRGDVAPAGEGGVSSCVTAQGPPVTQ